MYRKKHINFYKAKKFKNIIYVNYRFFILCSLILLSLLILTLRIFFLQIINTEHLIHEGDRRTLRIESILNTRGIINDRTGYPLAVTVLVNAVCADPTIIIKNQKNIQNDPRWQALSKAISIPLKQINSNINKHEKSKFIYLARQITPEIGNYIKKLQLSGVFLLKESKRYYTSGKIASQLIGITDIDGEGIEGIEKSFNKLLIGTPGKRKIRKDKKGQVIEKISLINRSISNNLSLSIDKKLQNIVYYKLHEAVKKNKADSGTAVLINIKTGEILAMANSPSYNPNNIIDTNLKQNIRNRAITDMFEPGSTIKPIVIMEGLKLGIIKENTVINTKPYLIKKHKIKDVSYHEKLTITGILQKSSNVGISKIALSIPITKLIRSYTKFGLGKPTKLGLVGEQNGFLLKKKNWSNLEKAAFSFGYGLMVTPLQLARLYATIGSYGIYHPLSIVKINKPVKGKRIFPKKYIKTVIQMMESVAKKGGGGIKASVKGYRVAIKTGTVKKVGIHGYYINQYVAYTAGIAPASNPKFSLVIIIDNPKNGEYYGGSISSPVFSKMMKLILKQMHIKKDNLLKKRK